MRVLIQRELEEMRVSSSKMEGIITTIIMGLIIVFFMWLLGPRIFGIDAKVLTAFVVIIGLLNAGSGMNLALEADSSSRQISFLQTLPILKEQIIHAKFISVLLLCWKTFVWMAVLISINLVINSDWSLESWTVVFLSISIVVFLMAENLLRYFLWGLRKKSNGLFTLSFIIWGVLFFLMFSLNSSVLSQSPLWGVLLFVFSLIVYLICWLISVKSVRMRGFPREVESMDFKKVEAFAEDLKSRQSEQKS